MYDRKTKNKLEEVKPYKRVYRKGEGVKTKCPYNPCK